MIDMAPADYEVPEVEKPAHEERVTTRSTLITLPSLFTNAPQIAYIVAPQLPLASVIKIPPKEEQNQTYEELTRTPQDEEDIRLIISRMGEHGKVWLLFNKSEMDQLGENVKHVHPLKFLGYIFADDYLKECMRVVREDYFKWTHFIDGLSPSMDNHLIQGTLEKYVTDFCRECKVTIDQVRPYFDSKDWKGLLIFLMNTNVNSEAK